MINRYKNLEKVYLNMIGIIFILIMIYSIFNYFIDNLIQLYNIHCPMIKVKEKIKNNKS